MIELPYPSENYHESIVGFLDSQRRQEWMEYDNGLTVYVRKGMYRVIDDPEMECLDIANIHLARGLRGKGVFTNWLAHCEGVAEARGIALYVENVINNRLIVFLRARGYEVVSDYAGVPCLIRKPSN